MINASFLLPSVGPSRIHIEGPGVIDVAEQHKFVCTSECLPSCRYVLSVGSQTVRGNAIELTADEPLRSVTLKCVAQNTVSRKTATTLRTVQIKGLQSP